MEASSLSEKQLLEQLSQGDLTAFWQLWMPYQKDLYHQCLTWMHGDVTEAQDALSRAMLKASDQLSHRAKNITNLKAWLIRLTHNICIDIYRERRRRAVDIDDFDAIAEQLENVLTAVASPVSAVLNRELGTAIQEAINTLPLRLRSPFTMHFEQEVSYLDITQQLDISIENVYKRVSQARTILKGRLSTYLSDDQFPDSSEAFLASTENEMEEIPPGFLSSILPLPVLAQLKGASPACPDRDLQDQSIQCPYCQSKQIHKNGHRNKKQNYRCQKCDRQFVAPSSPKGYPLEVRERCLTLYLNGMGVRAIGRKTGVCHNTIVNWIRQSKSLQSKSSFDCAISSGSIRKKLEHCSSGRTINNEGT